MLRGQRFLRLSNTVGLSTLFFFQRYIVLIVNLSSGSTVISESTDSRFFLSAYIVFSLFRRRISKELTMNRTVSLMCVSELASCQQIWLFGFKESSYSFCFLFSFFLCFTSFSFYIQTLERCLTLLGDMNAFTIHRSVIIPLIFPKPM